MGKFPNTKILDRKRGEEMELISIYKGEPITSSRKVAGIFHKQHFNVLRDIENIKNALEQESPKVGSHKMASEPETSKMSFQKMFFETTYQVEGNTKSYKEYLMNFDGFSILVMGFNGKKAIQFRVKFVEEFRKMREELDRIKLNKQNAEWLETRKDVKLLFREMTDTLQLLENYMVEHGSNNAKMVYVNYGKLINKTLGINPKSRDKQPTWILNQISVLQKMIKANIKGLLARNEDYHKIYPETKQSLENYARIAFINGSLLN